MAFHGFLPGMQGIKRFPGYTYYPLEVQVEGQPTQILDQDAVSLLADAATPPDSPPAMKQHNKAGMMVRKSTIRVTASGLERQNDQLDGAGGKDGERVLRRTRHRTYFDPDVKMIDAHLEKDIYEIGSSDTESLEGQDLLGMIIEEEDLVKEMDPFREIEEMLIGMEKPGSRNSEKRSS